MRIVLLLHLLLSGSTLLQASEEILEAPPLAPIPSEARQLALQTTGSLSEKGFKVRDADWAFTLEKAKTRLLRLTLFVGNEYQFVVATPVAGAALQIALYDDKGNRVPTESLPVAVKSGSTTLVSFSPKQGGEYFLGVSAGGNSSDLALDCSLLLAYK